MGRSPCCQQVGLKKGPWTPEEDQKLIAYVKEHGHGNWRALPKNCGLLRCGKSCRLRWTNYLRPDIKRGLFSDREEQTIIQLHALVGNKWAFIASQLPNRTDNEIKNYWNTVLKKRVEKGFSSLIRHHSQKWDDKFLCKKLHSSSTISKATTSMSSHLAQWESARLEAEARLVKDSKQSQTFKASLYMSPIPSYHPPHTISHASQKSLGKFSFPDQFTNCEFSYLTPNSKSTINSTCNFFSSSIVNNRTTSLSKSLVSSSESLTTSKLFPPQGSLTSTLKLGIDGKLSWNTQELSFRESESPQSSSSQQNSHIDFNKCQEESSSPLVSKRDYNNTSVTYNPLDVSSILNLHDILFEVENSSSNGVTEWEGEKDDIEDADDVACKKKNEELDGDNMNGAFSDKEDSRCILDLENLHLFHFDTLVVGIQHNNNFLINDKETMCNSSCSQILSYPTSILG